MVEVFNDLLAVVEDLPSFRCDERCKRHCEESRTAETKTAVHRVSYEFKCLLFDVKLLDDSRVLRVFELFFDDFSLLHEIT